MKIFRSSAEVPETFGPSIVTIGNFDGVHAGHRQIMRRVVALAREKECTPTVLTFDPHPARVLAPDRAPKLLMTMDQRLRGMETEGIEVVFSIPFSIEFAKWTPEEFVERILAGALKARVVLVGEDFRFGHRQAGNLDTLRGLGGRFGFTLEVVPGISRRGERISSTMIRKLVVEGAVSHACRRLGAPFALEGAVVQGQGIGSKQTVPTLNLAPENEVLPKTGVYVTRTRELSIETRTTDVRPVRSATARQWNSITNVGYRPTFDGEGLTVETFLLDPLLAPLDDTHLKHIEVSFLSFVRDERKFETPEALKKQILRDIGVAGRLHRRLTKLFVG
jgi:riboflavin kinase/FMN adenylyltransferase